MTLTFKVVGGKGGVLAGAYKQDATIPLPQDVYHLTPSRITGSVESYALLIQRPKS